MSPNLKQLAADVRAVREVTPSAWGLFDVRLEKLLKAIETQTGDAVFRARLEHELQAERALQRERFDVADALAAFDRATR